MKKYRICYIGSDETLFSSIEKAFNEYTVVREEPSTGNSFSLGAHHAGNDVLLIDSSVPTGEKIDSPDAVVTVYFYRSQDEENAIKALGSGFDSTWDADGGNVSLLKAVVEAETGKLLRWKREESMKECLGPTREAYNETVAALAEGAVDLLKLKEDLEKQNAELTLVRDELEQFVHTVSHDLKEPLMVVKTHAQIILEELEDVPDSTKDNLRLVRDSVDLMSRQIDSLLAFSRVGRSSGKTRVEDPSELIGRIIDSRGFNRREDVSIRITDALPAIRASSEQVKQILGNLISNGVKHNNSELKEVHIGITRKIPERIAGSFDSGTVPAGFTLFVVSDNGYGIPGKDHDAPFELFNRLVSHKETEGDGAGLAIVKRAVTSVGGNIDYVSTNGHGTRMYLTLPTATPQQIVGKSSQRKGRRTVAQIKAALL